MEGNYFVEKKEKAKALYSAQKPTYNPYLKCQVIFNSDGFHHLQFSARRERDKKEQLLKFSLLPLAIEIIKKAGTLQEYRKGLIAYGKSHGLTRMKEAEYWGFIAIVGGQKNVKIRTVLRRIGDGNVIFWSIMPFHKLRDQKLYTDGIDDG